MKIFHHVVFQTKNLGLHKVPRGPDAEAVTSSETAPIRNAVLHEGTHSNHSAELSRICPTAQSAFRPGFHPSRELCPTESNFTLIMVMSENVGILLRSREYCGGHEMLLGDSSDKTPLSRVGQCLTIGIQYTAYSIHVDMLLLQSRRLYKQTFPEDEKSKCCQSCGSRLPLGFAVGKQT